METIIKSWYQINRNISSHSKKVEEFARSIVAAGPNNCSDVIENIAKRVRNELGRQGGETQRRDFPLIEIEPSKALGDTLDFNPERILETIKCGYNDMLSILRASGKLDGAEHHELANTPIVKK